MELLHEVVRLAFETFTRDFEPPFAFHVEVYEELARELALAYACALVVDQGNQPVPGVAHPHVLPHVQILVILILLLCLAGLL